MLEMRTKDMGRKKKGNEDWTNSKEDLKEMKKEANGERRARGRGVRRSGGTPRRRRRHF